MAVELKVGEHYVVGSVANEVGNLIKITELTEDVFRYETIKLNPNEIHTAVSNTCEDVGSPFHESLWVPAILIPGEMYHLTNGTKIRVDSVNAPGAVDHYGYYTLNSHNLPTSWHPRYVYIYSALFQGAKLSKSRPKAVHKLPDLAESLFGGETNV